MASHSNLNIKGTSKTPEVNFSQGLLSITGRSIPEDSVAFYQPLMRWIETYVNAPEPITKVTFKIEYINSGSNRFIYSILKHLDECFQKGNKIIVNWCFEEDDDTIRGLGNDLKSFFEMPINLVEII